VSTAQRKQIIAQHKEEQTLYADYLGSQEARKELLLYGIGKDALAPLKKQYIKFGDVTIHSMILHLREKTAIKTITLQKNEYKSEGYAKQWDPTTIITAYFTGLDKFCTSLADHGISTMLRRGQWQRAQGCGKVKCSPRIKWLLGKASPQRSKHGSFSKTTSLRCIWNAASTCR
jgi:hypothetical protein